MCTICPTLFFRGGATLCGVMNSWMRSLQTEKTLATTLHGGNQRGHSLCLNNKRIAASSCCCKCAELRNDSSKSLQVGCDQHHCSCHHRSFKFCVGISDCLTSPHCITTLKGVSSQCNSSALRPNRPQGKTCGLFRFSQPQIHIEKRLIQKTCQLTGRFLSRSTNPIWIGLEKFALINFVF